MSKYPFEFMTEDTGIFDLDHHRNRRLLDALLYAERRLPGIMREVKQFCDHKGTLFVVLETDRSLPYIHDVFQEAWTFVGEDGMGIECHIRSELKYS